jgi:RimJ/RimL family protein N-acetyltransferase
MGWRTTGDVAVFLAAAGDYLRAERARNTVLLTVAETLRQNPARYHGEDPDPDGQPLFGWWSPAADIPGGPAASGALDASGARAAGEVRGAFLHTPPFPVLLAAIPAARAAELAAVTLAGRPLSGVNAHPEAALAFGAAWQESTGGTAAVRLRMRLYRLEQLSWPARPPGGAHRIARPEDAALLAQWIAAFQREANHESGTDATAVVRERLSYGGLALWEAAGRPVALAGLSRMVAGMARVGPVYTPPELRGRGYASALTAAVSQRALDTGADEVVLYTDLANPVSNSIYLRLGYRPVEDRLALAFPPG